MAARAGLCCRQRPILLAEDEAIPRLLDQWETIAPNVAAPARGGLPLAARLARTRARLAGRAGGVGGLPPRRRRPAVVGELLSQWRERAVAACASYQEPNQKPADSWVYWLIEARRDPAAHQARFLEHLTAWLDCCGERGVLRQALAFAGVVDAQPSASRADPATGPTFHSQC